MRPTLSSPAIALVFASCVLASAAAHAQRAVFVVRHAEKASPTEKDPVLSPRGDDRAIELSTFLRNINVDAIFVTDLKRTQLTAEPLSVVRDKKPVIIPAGDIDELVKQVRAQPADAVIVVVGHSDTVPKILEKLGVKQKVTIKDNEYDRLFLVTPGAKPDSPASLLEFKYGH